MVLATLTPEHTDFLESNMKKTVFNCATGKQEEVEMSEDEVKQIEKYWKQIASEFRQKSKMEILEEKVAALEASK